MGSLAARGLDVRRIEAKSTDKAVMIRNRRCLRVRNINHSDLRSEPVANSLIAMLSDRDKKNGFVYLFSFFAAQKRKIGRRPHFSCPLGPNAHCESDSQCAEWPSLHHQALIQWRRSCNLLRP